MAVSDADRIRPLLEAALDAQRQSEAADIAVEQARIASDKARDRHRNAVIELAGVLNGRAVQYGDFLINIGLNGSIGQCLIMRPIVQITVVTPSAPPPVTLPEPLPVPPVAPPPAPVAEVPLPAPTPEPAKPPTSVLGVPLTAGKLPDSVRSPYNPSNRGSGRK